MKIRVAVISDLHSRRKSRRDPKSGVKEEDVSYLPAHPGPSDHNPFADLHSLIKRESLATELLMCPGDICDKGDDEAFAYAWDQLQALQGRLKAERLIATCGNHDLDSRYASDSSDDDPDPKGNLLRLEPAFPFGDSTETNHFWARDFVALSTANNVRVLALNTSAYHGGKDAELLHGRVSSRTIAAIGKALEAQPAAALNILLCHHHLQPLRMR